MTETKRFGEFIITKEVTDNEGSIVWKGEDPMLINGFAASNQFNAWADELFETFMRSDELTEYLDAWKSANNEMGPGKEVIARVIGADGFIECIICHSDEESQTSVKFYRRETGE